MPQKFAFTTAAMAAALEETPVSYEDLADIEREFDDAETAISEFSCATAQRSLSSISYQIINFKDTSKHKNKNKKPNLQLPFQSTSKF